MGSQPVEVPLLDFSRFEHGNAEQQQNFCKNLKEVLSTYGFAKLENHAIPKHRIDELFYWSRLFFNLPLDVKMRAPHPKEPNPHRGFSYVGQEKLSRVKDFEKGVLTDEAVNDIKESFDQGSETDPLYRNIWLPNDDLPGFREFMSEFYEECHATHMQLLEVLATAFELPTSYFRHRCEDNTSELRLNHYPRVRRHELTGSGGAKRISEHTDFGTLTLLFQDGGVGGLEIETQDGTGEYVPVRMRGDQAVMIVNVGDCLQRWTNERLRSASHRVTAPRELAESDLEIDERFSVAYFGKPDRSSGVSTLSEFVSPGSTAKYVEAMTALEYNQSKLLRTY